MISLANHLNTVKDNLAFKRATRSSESEAAGLPGKVQARRGAQETAQLGKWKAEGLLHHVKECFGRLKTHLLISVNNENIQRRLEELLMKKTKSLGYIESAMNWRLCYLTNFKVAFHYDKTYCYHKIYRISILFRPKEIWRILPTIFPLHSRITIHH